MRQGRIYCFGAGHEVDPEFAKELQCIQKLLERSRKSVKFPNDNDIGSSSAAVVK